MSAIQAELARKCLYYMALMREIEDRVERKLQFALVDERPTPAKRGNKRKRY